VFGSVFRRVREGSQTPPSTTFFPPPQIGVFGGEGRCDVYIFIIVPKLSSILF